MRRHPFKSMVALCALVVLCGTPLASARAHVVPSGIVTVEATSPSGAAYTYDPSGFTCTPAPGTTFPLGDTTVNCVDAGGITVASFTVRVVDTIPPVVTPPANVNVTTGNPSGTAVTYGAASATDAVAGAITPSCSPSSGSNFPVGTTTVTCSASDGTNTGTATSTVTVTLADTTPPVLSVPGTVTAEATSGSGAVVTYTASATDPDDTVATFGCSPASGSTLGLGSYTATCNATDSNGNSSSASFTINVVDTTGPVISGIPSPPPVEATSTSGAVVTYTLPTANDAVTGNRAVGCTPPSGSTFSIGTTSVQCTASDGNGNSTPASFNVQVQDTVAPVITQVPADISADATSPGGAVVGYSNPSATDLGASVPVNCSPGSGSTFAVGTTTVTCTSSDGRGNSSSAQFRIVIAPFDATPPVIGVPADITVEAVNGNGATVSYSVSFTDPDDAVTSSSCVPASGSIFGLGTTTVNCSATDAHSNSSSKSFKVTVRDTTPPTVGSPPADITREATASGGAVVTFTKPSASDAVDGSVPVTCTPASGSTFRLGGTNVDCTATDAHGNSATKSFKITVKDTTPPVFGPAADVNANATSGAGAVVTYTKPTATDAVDGPVPVTCTPASGAAFSIGTTTVSCNASDSGGQSSSTTFKVIVKDITPPVITVPTDITAEATGPGGASVNYTFSSRDPDDAVAMSNCTPAPGSTFALGPNTVTCNATDSHNNSASKTFKITVVDTTPPNLSNVPADITAEANGPAGSKVNFVPPTAVDLVNGPIPTVPCVPASNSTFPLGTTTVICSASDSRGNTRSAPFKVKVVDTTPPTLHAPGDTSVYATVDAGADPLDEGPISRFLGGAFVADIVDTHPGVTNDHPVFFVVGTTTVKFTATDASGNKTSASSKLTVLPKPAQGTTPPTLPPPRDNAPPANVNALSVKAGDGRATFKWTNPSDSDFAYVEITRTTSAASFKAVGTVVYKGTATSYVDRGLQNGIEYRYVFASFDKNGNSSVGTPIVVVPTRALLRTPTDGTRLKKIPKKFVWVADPRASYYNLQLYAGGTLLFKSTSGDPNKILSAFPTKAVYAFKSPWKWEGRRYKMTKGLYTWYVWPGYGARSEVKYGPLMGSATFQVTK